MPYDFTFETEHEYGESALGITVYVTLRFGDDSFEFPAKIDTGAESCIFRREYGEMLGIDVESGQREDFSTATGSFVAFGHDLSFSILGYDFDGVIYFARDYKFPRDVLGRRSLLERISLCIVDYERKLYLSRYDPAKSYVR